MTLTEFHPELRSRARVIPKSPIRPLTLPFFRVATRLLNRAAGRGVEVLTIADGVGVRLFRPAGGTASGPALLWIHGGGYVIGTAAQDDLLCRRYAAKLGVTVASVEYRLAPEHPYPTPGEDCYTASTPVGWPSQEAARAAVWPQRWPSWPATAARWTSPRRSWPTR